MVTHAIIRRLIALLIVCSDLLLPAAPLLQAAIVAETACPCCKRAGIKSCCRRHHTGSGPAIDSVPNCCGGCTQSPSIAPSADYAVALASLVCVSSPSAVGPLSPDTAVQTSSQILFWLYQRPPPLSRL